MSISELRDDVQGALANFLWDEWGQMGVSADTSRRDSWAMDPEALLLLTFEVGRGEPRLFEEVLDWMLVNERLLSVQRLRNLAEDDDDRALVEAVLGWLGQNRRRERLKAKPGATKKPRPFFRESRLRVSDPDPAFLAQGFLKPQSEPSRKSLAPTPGLPINFVFRLRPLLGVSVRAEVTRILLTMDSPWMNAQTLAMSTAYTKRNVQEALASLGTDGFADYVSLHNEHRYKMPRERWRDFLGSDPLPSAVDWPQLSRALRVILRWLFDSANQDLSDYMPMSKARTLAEEIEPDLRFAGVRVNTGEATRDMLSFEGFLRGLFRSTLSVDL